MLNGRLNSAHRGTAGLAFDAHYQPAFYCAFHSKISGGISPIPLIHPHQSQYQLC